MVDVAPILVPALHPNSFVSLSQSLFRGRSHFEADFASGAERQFGTRGQAKKQVKAAVLVGGGGPDPLRWLLSSRNRLHFKNRSKC